MKHAFATTALLGAALLSGCATAQRYSAVHTLAVDGKVANKHNTFYKSGGTDAIELAGAFGLGILGAYAVEKGATHGTRHLMDDTNTGQQLEKAVTEAFTAELQRNGGFPLATSGDTVPGGRTRGKDKIGPADATFQLEIDRFGFDHSRGLVCIKARLMKGSECIFDETEEGRTPKEKAHTFKQCKAQPSLFFEDWKLAAAESAREIVKELREQSGQPKAPAPAPAPTGATPKAAGR